MMKTKAKQKHEFFPKMMTTQVLRPYLKEAKRVGYTVSGSVKDGFIAVVTDACEQHPAGEVVMRGVKKPGVNVWIMGFNTLYWQEPTIAECLAQSKWYADMEGKNK
jgi:hypothetical protein